MPFPPLKVMLACCLMISPQIALAETFAIQLGKTTLGELRYSANSKGATLTSTLANTPLGVFNGTYEGTSRPAKAADGTQALRYVGVGKSSRKTRSVDVLFAAGRALETIVIPAKEETTLSDPQKVRGAVTDPVRAIGLLTTAIGCPARINIYDGRRVITLSPTAQERQDTLLICALSYTVTAGPGHLSPLKIAKAKMQVTYSTANNDQQIQNITLGAGMFNLVLTRTK